LDGLISELRSWGEEFTVLHQTFTFAERWMYEQGIIFLFGRLYKFFSFRDISIWSKGLDAVVRWQDEVKELEFEVLSSGFKEHIKRGDVKPENYKNTIIVCWEDDWKDRPTEIDTIVMKDLLELGLKDLLAA
jgi:hypothetical protein